ncbi:putative capsid protein [Didemnum sp. Sea Squirt associated virus]|uniref:putative capsid protein n=1 Tax=Didemnum sp. Sea Squirt associated virus TaxID=1692247 RepID=UPI0006A6B22C|nr:putative capsid protein [Didemnum sp. Sea Squirt associated virus]AKV62259.1 putative capsid protein [Didemnum sp. Sea Squirt associated virus]
MVFATPFKRGVKRLGAHAARSKGVKRRMFGRRRRPIRSRFIRRGRNLSSRVRTLEKFHETKFSLSNIAEQSPSVGVPTSLNIGSLAVGDDANTREGNKVSLIRFDLRMNWVMADAYQAIRIILVSCDHVSPADLTLANVLDANHLIARLNINSSYKRDQRPTPFRVIWDRRYKIRSQTFWNTVSEGVGVAPDDSVNIRKSFHFPRGRKMQFRTASTDNPVRGGFKLFYMSDSAAAPHPTCLATTQLLFKDG